MFANPTNNLSGYFKSCAKTRILGLSWSSGFFLLARSSTQNLSKQFVLCIQFSFVKFGLRQSLRKNSNGIRSGDSNIFISVINPNLTHVYINVFLTMTDIIASQNIDLSSWIVLHIYLLPSARSKNHYINVSIAFVRLLNYFGTRLKLKTLFIQETKLN
jgi:hypothetical protein